MPDALIVAQYLTAVGFLGLGVRTLVGYLRTRDSALGWLALAIGMISLVAVLGRITPLLPSGLVLRSLQALSLVAFMASGYGLLKFRATFIPLSRRLHRVVVAALVVICAAYISVQPPSDPKINPTPLQSAIVLLVVLTWCACVVEPIARFWIAGRGRPAVQRARLRSLSLGFASIVAVLLVAVVAGTAANAPAPQLAINLLILGIIPLLYVSFSPPAWVRREWRVPEEAGLQAGIHQLLLFSPSRKVLAERALEWAVRLVGADAAAIAEHDGTVLASHGIDPSLVASLAADVDKSSPSRLVPLQSSRKSAIVVQLPMEQGSGALVVISGPFTPVFGTDELNRLVTYSSAITAGLDRALVTERLAALEATKTHFLNLASHELRGPLTVLRGYLSMIENGSLGEVSNKVQTVLPLLAGKADEMNFLVDQMLEAARLEEGRLELHPERRDLSNLAEHAVEVMRPLAGDKHRIVVDKPEGEVPVTVDPDRIGTILSNLIDNALKYSPAGGEVRLAIRQANGSGLVSVTDSGVGIAPEDLPKLFTRFGRVVTNETSHIGGTGLGLYLSRELARLHSGDITVQSSPGGGSTFVLTVPADR